jgi:hypothetical protein
MQLELIICLQLGLIMPIGTDGIIGTIGITAIGTTGVTGKE